MTVTDAVPEPDPAPQQDTEPALSPEVLEALGDLMPEKPKYGAPINKDLARIWDTILKHGLTKENKLKLEKNVPENCCLLKAPMLNPEIIASVSDTIINRDKKIETEQNQLGMGLTILGEALSMLINDNNTNRLKLISQLSDAARILTDLHYIQTKSRKNLIFPALDKKILEIVKEVERDDYLYGNNLSEKIKALQACQRTGQSIKKPTAFTTTRQGNLSGPPRYNQQRTNLRPGHKKPQSSFQTRKYQPQQNNQYQPQQAARKPKAPPSQDKLRARQ
ncbi:hypothetical protein PYW07_001503 [Mythimna separata]|uniref:Uncharacterized protein n=1 Tax=Mythimna separata TaxID=271217 RepID=A0AAD8DX14_MYTSE|nr:hypothetical protein PYW07_001503 [Mythimna separata]